MVNNRILFNIIVDERKRVANPNIASMPSFHVYDKAIMELSSAGQLSNYLTKCKSMLTRF